MDLTSSSASLPLNAEEEPELPDYPKDPHSLRDLVPEACCTAWRTIGMTRDGSPLGRVGKQTIKDTALDKKRMEPSRGNHFRRYRLDGEAGQDSRSLLLWYNSTAMHFRTTSLREPWKERQDDYSDRMVTHDEQIGQVPTSSMSWA